MAQWTAGAVHDPAKVLSDLAVTLAVGGDCLADLAVLRAEPGVPGRVASESGSSRRRRPGRESPRGVDAIAHHQRGGAAGGPWPVAAPRTPSTAWTGRW